MRTYHKPSSDKRHFVINAILSLTIRIVGMLILLYLAIILSIDFYYTCTNIGTSAAHSMLWICEYALILLLLNDISLVFYSILKSKWRINHSLLLKRLPLVGILISLLILGLVPSLTIPLEYSYSLSNYDIPEQVKIAREALFLDIAFICLHSYLCNWSIRRLLR